MLEPGDLILADKFFPQIRFEIGKRNALLVMPPFAHGSQLSEESIEETFKIMSVRVHVERAIQRIRLFNILKCIDLDMLSSIDVVMHVCCV